MGVYADGGLENVVFFPICFEKFRFFDFFHNFVGLFSDSSRFSASVPPIFTPKGALGGDFGPKQNFGKS